MFKIDFKSFFRKLIKIFFIFTFFVSLFFVFSKFWIKQNTLNLEEANKINYSRDNAYKYSNFEIQGTSWLSFRDVPDFIRQYVKGKKTVDFGCGSGRSTRFLKNLGLDVVGVDVSKEYLDQAYRVDKLGKYILLEKGQIPFENGSCDLVFSSHVFLMIPTKGELNLILDEVSRVLKKNGIFIVVTGSEEMHSYDEKWISYQTNFSENIKPKSGSIVKLKIKDVGAVFCDYNWTNEDYLEVIQKSDFEILEIHFPLGKDDDGIQWLSEKHTSPYVIYVLRKK